MGLAILCADAGRRSDEQRRCVSGRLKRDDDLVCPHDGFPVFLFRFDFVRGWRIGSLLCIFWHACGR